jgi:hypothetical protein
MPCTPGFAVRRNIDSRTGQELTDFRRVKQAVNDKRVLLFR